MRPPGSTIERGGSEATRAFSHHVHGPCDLMVDVAMDGVAPAIDPNSIVPEGWVEEATFEEFEQEPSEGEEEGSGGVVRIQVERTLARWVIAYEAPVLDAANSPAFTRAFYVPWWSAKRNAYGSYRVYRRV